MAKHDHRHIFIDIDGTLTEDGGRPWAMTIERRLETVRAISGEYSVILWSGRGAKYARDFNERHKLGAHVCIGKPDMVVDDHPSIRPFAYVPPEKLDDMSAWS